MKLIKIIIHLIFILNCSMLIHAQEIYYNFNQTFDANIELQPFEPNTNS